jgi:UDP-2,4-diacetamido-2,4,6-trideoxy-beta-L-altropyranose hydrolase
MRIAIRADSGTQIGGGHVMRCLSLAVAAKDAGHDVHFICADVDGNLGTRIAEAGVNTVWLTASNNGQRTGEIENWRPMLEADDAEKTIQALNDFAPDWLILDHYGLSGAWVKKIRSAFPGLKVLAVDDLDRTPLFADLLLNPAAVPGTELTQPQMGMLKGPSYAMLRPEFTNTRPAALNRRTGIVQKILILPGMVDSKQMASVALEALRDFPDMQAEVIMGSQSPSVAQVRKLITDQPNWSLTLDATNMAHHMSEADASIGAGEGSAWERCSLGLPSINIALADNQVPGVQAIAEAGAAIGLAPPALSDSQTITDALHQLIANYAALSQNAAALCDGLGATRVISAMTGKLRDVTINDAKLIFDWRNQLHIRDAIL